MQTIAFSLCALALCLPFPARAAELTYEYLPASTDLSLEQALRSANWISGSGHASFGFDGQGKWLRYQLPAPDDVRLFTIDNPWLTHIDVYLLRNQSIAERYLTGNARPHNNRPVSSAGFTFTIDPTITDVYVYDHGKSVSYFPVQLLSAAEYSNHASKLNVFHGFYYGIVLIMILYNLAMFAGTRDRTYIYYSAYAFCLVLFLTAADGTGAMFLWPQLPEMQHFLYPIAWGAAFVLLFEFARRYLEIEENDVFRAARRLAQITFLLVTLAVIAAPGPLIYTVQTLVSAIALAVLIYAAISNLQRRRSQALVFLIANGMFAVGCFAHIATLLAFVEPSIVLHHSIHLGSAAELALLSIALVGRLREYDKASYAAFQRSQELTRRNKELSTAKALAEEHRQLQKSLQQAQKLKTIGQLAGGFAHDFNNILASILGFAELARDKSSLTDRPTLLRYLEEIQKSGERGANLVKQLLVYSRSTASEPEELNLGDTLHQAQDLLRGSLPATIAIDTHLPEQPVRLFIDPEQLQQVIVNLCINAAESMNNRGQIDIRLDTEHLQNLNCTSCLTRFSGEHIAIKVEDSGAGIQGNAEQLFTPFYTSKDVGQGTGLGLSVVHGIVHEHGGHVHAANRAEGGARFVVYLPPQPLRLGAEDRGKRILLIEDDASVTRYLESLLKDDAYQTTFASMPTEALETFVADPDAFDLVITDHLMPHATGLELAEDIHALRPDLPVILTTGNKNNLDPNAVAAAGLAGIFEKPLNSEQLLAKIRGLLAG